MYRARFVIVLAAFLLALACFALLALIPSYLALRLATPPVADTSITHKGGAPGDAIAIARAQALVRILSPVLSATTSPTALITEALSQRPKGISVDHVTYDVSAGHLVLVGTGMRDAINSYRDTLSKDLRFPSVSVPVSALVGSDSGHFSMTLTLAP